MSLLASHLEQIGYSCEGIDSLPFPPPKIFTNALLSNHDITALIRDTESHERALFSVPPPPSTTQTSPDPSEASTTRRKTVFNVASGSVTTGPPTRGGGGSQQHQARRHTAVAAVLGGQLHEQVRHSETRNVDVEVLLKGAEKLCGVYELPGARDRIAQLRARDRNGKSTLEYYEGKVREQTKALEGLSAARGWREEEEEEEDDGEEVWTEEDLRREEEGVREMEVKKRELQARLRAMEKDLGGLMRM
ncbi:DASH complex subunit spc34 domain-containing protein [Sarocladium implicatum]|nr:DASH complex subunit spc34 domain-containing protein [Sarocladium implicatum]